MFARNCLVKALLFFVCGGIVSQVTADDATTKTIDIPALPWREVDKGEAVKILDMVAIQTRTNYEKIHTWKGIYSVDSVLVIDKEKIPGKPDVPEGVFLAVQFDVDFVIDMASNQVCRRTDSHANQWINRGTGVRLDIPSYPSYGERSIVTPEHYVRFNPTNTISSLAALPDHPDARGKRVGYIEVKELGDRESQQELLEPRFFYGNSGTKYWEYFEEFKTEVSDPKLAPRVFESAGPGGVWYRICRHYTDPRYGKTFSTYILSPESGFNPILKISSVDLEGTQLEQSFELVWTKNDGIYVPQLTDLVKYEDPFSGKVRYRRQATLKQCKLNEQLAPDQFGYESIGMKDGDILLDNIKKVVYMVKDGKTEKLGAFGGKYSPIEDEGWGRKETLTALSAVTLLLLILIFRRRMAAKRHAE